MLLTHAKGMAEEYTEQKGIRDVVLTAPAFFNQAERRALAKAVELAGLWNVVMFYAVVRSFVQYYVLFCCSFRQKRIFLQIFSFF